MSETQLSNISKCIRNIEKTMSEDETCSIKHVNYDSDMSDTGRSLLETDENRVVCEPRIHDNGKGKVDGERIKQTSTGRTREFSSHKKNLYIQASYPDGEMNTRSSRKHHIQRGECGNVQDDCKVERFCSGRDTDHKEMHIFSEGKTQDPSTTPATLEEDLQVPDGGWGWMVAIGTLIGMMLSIPIALCFGILFSEYLLEKGTSTTTTTWIFNTQCFIWHFVTPLIRPLVKEFGWRRIGYIGVFMSSSSIILSAFSSSAEFLFFSYSLLSGIGVSVMVGICLIILPLYFDRRRGLANTFLMAGACLGPIVIAPFVRHLLDNYSYKGGALIYGAILMNGFVAVSLFHPVKWHMKKPRRKTDQPPETLAPLIPQKGSSDGPQEPMNLLDIVPQHEGTKMEPDLVTVVDQVGVKRTRCNTSHRVGECSQDSVILNISSGITVSDTNCTPDSREGYKGNGCLGVIKTLWMILVRVAHTTKSDVGILRSRRALIIALANTLMMSSFLNFTMLLPFVMEAEGHTLQDSAWCLSVMGICNLATRLTVSPLSDWKRFDKRLCIMSGCVVMGSAILVFSFVTDLVWITVASAAFGYSLGATVTFCTLVTIQYLGIENLAATYGVSSLIEGCAYLVTGPTIGFIRDKSGSYAVSLWVLAALPFLAFILWLSMPAAVAYDNRKRQKETTRDPCDYISSVVVV